MSCDNCDHETDNLLGPIAYVRVGNANVAIIGCQEHLRMLIEKLRAADRPEGKKKA